MTLKFVSWECAYKSKFLSCFLCQIRVTSMDETSNHNDHKLVI